MLLRQLLHQVLEAEAGTETASAGTPTATTTETETTSSPISTPPSAPTTEEAETTETAEANVSVDWEALASPLGDEDEEDGQPEVPAKPAAAPTSTSTPPVAAAPAATPETPSASAPAKPAEVAPATPPAAETATPPAAKTPEQLQAEVAESEKQALAELEKFYALPEEAASALQTEPEVILPKLAAQVHRAVMQQVMNQVVQSLPGFLQGYNEVRTKEAAAKDAFYKANSDLLPFEKQVLEAGPIWRRMNPDAPPEKAIAGIANMVRAAMGLPIPGTPSGSPPSVSTPSQPRGYQPASAGGTTHAAPVKDDNIFSAMAEDLLREDAG